MIKLIYYAKKLVGLNSHYDDMAMMHQSWSVNSGVIGSISEKIANLFPSFIGVGGGSAGTFGAAMVGVIVTAKVSAVSIALFVVAEASMSTAETIENRGNQARAVIADTVAHPINLDKALNPAYHGKRDQLDNSLLLTSQYNTKRYGENYNITPYAGYGQHTTKKKMANGEDGILIVPEQYEREDTLIQGRSSYEELAQAFKDEEERKKFLRSVGKNYNDDASDASVGKVLSNIPLISDSGSHGIEVKETVSEVIQILHDGTVIKREYTTVIKQQAFGETSYLYLISLFNGGNLGPTTYVNIISEKDGKRILVNPRSPFLDKVTGYSRPIINAGGSR